jgi:hypothetical protein
LDNDWYEYVEYGTTNPLSIMLQKCGFSRETSDYIKNHRREYEAFKQRLAVKYKNDRDAYTEAKSDFIKACSMKTR